MRQIQEDFQSEAQFGSLLTVGHCFIPETELSLFHHFVEFGNILH